MYKYSIAILLFVSSCNTRPVWSTRDVFVIDNVTNVKLCHAFMPNKQNFANIYPTVYVDTEVFVLPKMKITEKEYFLDKLTERWACKCLYIDMVLYNLSDTSKIEGEYSNPYIADSSSSFFMKNYKQNLLKTSDYDCVTVNTLVLTDSLLKFFKKDYGMLQRFSEFYKSK